MLSTLTQTSNQNNSCPKRFHSPSLARPQHWQQESEHSCNCHLVSAASRKVGSTTAGWLTLVAALVPVLSWAAKRRLVPTLTLARSRPVSSPSVARVLVVNVFSFRCAQDADKPNYETRHLKPNHTDAVLFSGSQSFMYLILKAFSTQSATNQGVIHTISKVINSLGRHNLETFPKISRNVVWIVIHKLPQTLAFVTLSP